MKSIIVIGAGIGGLAVAGRLARQGYQVTVFEKGNHPGGRTARLERDGYRFDTGPTLFLMPEIFHETYAALGERMEDHLQLKRLDPTYRVHFHDDSTLDLSSDLGRMRRQLDAIEAGSFGSYLRFMAEGYQNYQISLKHFVGRNFTSLFDYFSPGNLPLLFKLKALVKHADNTARFFKDQRLQAAFSFQNMYLGLSPYEAPATYSLLQYTELGDGVWFPMGGMYQVIESMEAIGESLGVRFHYNTPVERIEVNDGRATGVRLSNGERLDADVIIANADLPYVYANMLPDEGYARRMMNKKFTSSTLMFYWGVKGERSRELLHHNVFLTDHRYRESFEDIFQGLTLPEEPSFYVCAPTRSDASFAPADGDSLMVLVPVGHMDDHNPQNWAELEKRARRTVIERLEGLGVRDLEKRITFEAKVGPSYYRDELNLAKGSAFGLSHNFTQVGYLRPHNRHPRYKNLYFAGASTHPGTGLPIVLLSARLAAERIFNEQPAATKSVVSISKQLAEQV
ncbi:MAG: phytoene desaturase family protein [Anaerolineales bacterium]|jgi:phytoene desaturase